MKESFFSLEEIIFVDKNQFTIIPCLVTGNILIQRKINSWEELISAERKLFCSSSRRISFGRKNAILKINTVDKKLLCSITGGNSFGRKFYFWKEFILLRDIISVDKKLMRSDPERISVDRFIILERIYFLWKDFISVRN